MTEVLKSESEVTDNTSLRVEDLGVSSYSYNTDAVIEEQLGLSPAFPATKKARTYESSYTSVHSDAPELSLHNLTVELRTLTDPIHFGILLNVPQEELVIIQKDHNFSECMHVSKQLKFTSLLALLGIEKAILD